MNAEEHRAAAVEALEGCQRLLVQLEESRERLKTVLPIDATELAMLRSADWDPLYAFQMRFLLIQDLASRRLMPAFLALGAEDPRNFSFREAVDRTAELGGIVSGEEWLELSTVRNQLAHDYPVDLEHFLTRLDDAWSRCDPLIANVTRLVTALKQRGM